VKSLGKLNITIICGSILVSGNVHVFSQTSIVNLKLRNRMNAEMVDAILNGSDYGYSSYDAI